MRHEYQEIRTEWLRCWHSPAHFLGRYGWVYDATERAWLRFDLWPSQRRALRVIHSSRLVVALKARQLGMSWLCTGYALWHMILRPGATVLFFSKRDDEAIQLLDMRLKGMYRRLPDWLRCRWELKSTSHEWRLSNGSAALAFPTTGGRSYTASLAVVDEADFAPDLDGLLNAVKPTIDAGGRLILLSTADKSRPESAFKRIYWAAKAGDGGIKAEGGRLKDEGCSSSVPQPSSSGGWTPLFLSWRARPDRTEEWYVAQQADVLARTGALDDLYQEYPATDLEALAPRSLDARFPAAWLEACSGAGDGGRGIGDGSRSSTPMLQIPGLEAYERPEPGKVYVIGADPAEGNPQSDESAATVLEEDAGREVASLAGRFDPAVFAAHLATLSREYNGAKVLVERNNHGHAVILALKEHRGEGPALLEGLDGKPGWLTTARSKALAYDYAAERFSRGEAGIRSTTTLRQLQAIRGATLSAPEGQSDDRAMSFVLALAALKWGKPEGTGQSAIIPPYDPLWKINQEVW